MSQNKKKRNYWIDSKVQWAIVQKALLLNAAIVALLFIADKLFFFRMQKMGKDLGFSPDHIYFLFLQEQQKIKFWMFLLTAGVITVASVFIGVRFSHRIAGPIFKLKREMRKINDGEKVEEINLRDSDFFSDLAEEFNSMTLKHDFRKKDDEAA